MEEKKILWVVVAVSGFLILVLGFAMVFYSTNRETAPLLQAASTRPQVTGNNLFGSNSAVQADQTAHSPENTAVPTSQDSIQQAGTASGTSPISVTIVNGENASANYTTLDVSGLTGDQGATLLAVSPPDTAMSGETKATNGAAAGATAGGTGSAQPNASSTPAPRLQDAKTSAPVQTQTSAVSAAKTATASPKANPATKAAVTVTEYWIQTGSFSGKLNAEKARETLKARYLNTEIFTRDVAGKTAYRVRVGPYKNKSEADYWLGVVRGIDGFAESYVSEVKAKR